MAEAKVTLSDFSATVVPDAERVRLVIKNHPVLDEVVELDAAETEVAAMLKSEGQYIFVEAHLPDGTVKTAAVSIQSFDAAFTGDPYQALKDARRVAQPNSKTGAKRGNAEHLAEVRAWAKLNGWPDIKDRGRVAQEVEEAYLAATADT